MEPINNNISDFYQTYLVCKKNYGVFDSYRSDLLNYKETLEKMKKNRFSIDSVYTQLRAEIEVNENLLNDTKDSISKFEKEAREFSLLILVNNDKKVFISQHINPFKDYYGKYQVVGGKKESNESFLDCAIREAKEESGVEIKIEDLNLIGTCEGFRVFPNSEGKQILYRTAIYYSIIDQIPQHTEPKNHAEWISVDLKELTNYDMTDSIRENMSIILDKINKKFRSIRNAESKKRSAEKRKLKEIEGSVIENPVVNRVNKKKKHQEVKHEESSDDEGSSPN